VRVSQSRGSVQTNRPEGSTAADTAPWPDSESVGKILVSAPVTGSIANAVTLLELALVTRANWPAGSTVTELPLPVAYGEPAICANIPESSLRVNAVIVDALELAT